MKVMEVEETKEGRLVELDVMNAGMHQETMHCKEMDRRLYQKLIACTKGEAKKYVCNPERSRFKAFKQMVSHLDPKTSADRSVAYAPVTHPGSHSGQTSARHKAPRSARNIMQLQGGRG